MRYQVCRSQHPGLVQVIEKNLSQAEAIRRCQTLIDQADETVPTYFTRKQHFSRRKPS